MRGPETRLRKRIVKALQEEFPGGLFLKVHGGPMQNIGIPDLLCCVEGKFIGLEVKTPRGHASPPQLLMLERIVKAKGASAIVRSPDDAIEAVRVATRKRVTSASKAILIE